MLRALVTSAEHGNRANSMVKQMHSDDPRMAAIQSLLTMLVFGEAPPAAAGPQLVTILRNRRCSACWACNRHGNWQLDSLRDLAVAPWAACSA